MILHGVKRKILKDCVAYYAKATEKSHEDFLNHVLNLRSNTIIDDADYSIWLGNHIVDLLVMNEITLEDMIENKDIIRSATMSDMSRKDGEFYTPEIWCQEGRNYIKEIVGKDWGTDAIVWDASCYTMDTELLTLRGWVHYDELRKTDLVYSLNPTTESGEFVGIERMFKKHVDEDLLHFYGGKEHIDLYVTRDHSVAITDCAEGLRLKSADWIWRTVGDNYYTIPSCAIFNNAIDDGYSQDELLGFAKRFLSRLYTDDAYSLYTEFIKKHKEVRNTLGYRRTLLDLSIFSLKTIFQGVLAESGTDITNVHELGYCELTFKNKYVRDIIDLIVNLCGYTTVIPDDGLVLKVYTNNVISIEPYSIKPRLYVGDVWDITLEKNHIFKVRRNGVACFSGNCGTGNLMKSENYKPENLFLSTLLEEDVSVVKSIYPDSECFSCDFLKDIDYDEYNDMFSRNLPERLLNALKTDKHIVFFMNPPYKVGVAQRTDVGAYMDALGLGKCGLDLFGQFVYRIIMLKKHYNITNMTIGLYGPVTLYHSRMLKGLLDELYEHFQFRSGMCFRSDDFSGTSTSVAWVVGYTVWSTWKEGEDKNNKNQIVLDSKVIDMNGNVSIIGKRLFTDLDENLDEWIKPKDVERYEKYPAIKSCMTPTGVLGTLAENALGQVMTSNYVIRATRRAAVFTLPNNDGCNVTTENFWRCVASFVARRCYVNHSDSFKNCQYYAQPNTRMEGYDKWLADALPVFLFDFSALQASYRNFETPVGVVTMSNALFPLSKDFVMQFVTDQNIIADLNSHPQKNMFLLEKIEDVKNMFGPEAQELFLAGAESIVESLMDEKRKRVNYANSTVAWDAGLAQIRMTKGLWTEQQEKRVLNALSKLKNRLYEEVYKYGFLMDLDMNFDEVCND
jgi:hypothetical protein